MVASVLAWYFVGGMSCCCSCVLPWVGADDGERALVVRIAAAVSSPVTPLLSANEEQNEEDRDSQAEGALALSRFDEGVFLLLLLLLFPTDAAELERAEGGRTHLRLPVRGSPWSST
jgi:hypothetical protein